MVFEIGTILTDGGAWAYISQMIGLARLSYMTVMPSAEAVCNQRLSEM